MMGSDHHIEYSHSNMVGVKTMLGQTFFPDLKKNLNPILAVKYCITPEFFEVQKWLTTLLQALNKGNSKVFLLLRLSLKVHFICVPEVSIYSYFYSQSQQLVITRDLRET